MSLSSYNLNHLRISINMGQQLSAPIKDKVGMGEATDERLSYACSSMQGWRIGKHFINIRSHTHSIYQNNLKSQSIDSMINLIFVHLYNSNINQSHIHFNLNYSNTEMEDQHTTILDLDPESDSIVSFFGVYGMTYHIYQLTRILE